MGPASLGGPGSYPLWMIKSTLEISERFPSQAGNVIVSVYTLFPQNSLSSNISQLTSRQRPSNSSIRRRIRLSLNGHNGFPVSLYGLFCPHYANLVLIFKLPTTLATETNVPKCPPLLYRAPESHERIKRTCRCEQLNMRNAAAANGNGQLTLSATSF